MSANRAVFPIATMARVLGVSESGYHAWLCRAPCAHAIADAALLKRIRTVHTSSRETYGAPRVHAELLAGDERHGRKRIARLMREAGLVGASRRRSGPITTRRDKEVRPAPDLVDRDFSATKLNQLWVADITFIPTAAGFLYLAVVLDAWSRKIVGWAMAITCGPTSCSTRWRRRSLSAGPTTSSTTPTVRMLWLAVPGRPDSHSDRPARVAGATGHLGAV
jgi:putative transposase